MKYLLLSLLSLSAFAQDSCRPPGIRFPVSDQDGLGTCASNTASLVMAYNIQGMTKVPSYLQLAVAASGRTTDKFFKAATAADNLTPGLSGDVLFVNSNQICNVINTGMNEGFCDSNLFPLDYLGQSDPFRSQQRSMEKLGRILQGNLPGLEELRTLARTTEERPNLIRRVAQILFADAQTCRQNPREYMAKKLWERQRQHWQRQLATLPPAQRQQLQTVMSRTFTPDGQPTKAAVDFAMEGIFDSNSQAVLNRDLLNETRSATQIPELRANEEVFGVHWGYRLGLESPNFLARPGARPDAIRRDWAARSGCEAPANIRAMEKYFQDPNCALTASPIPQEFLDVAEGIIKEFRMRDFDPQIAMIGIIAPACAEQARSRRVSGLNCQSVPAQSEQTSREARRVMAQELCAGRAVGISVCSDFLDRPTPEYSQYCRGKNAFHAMTAIDMRTVNGKRQYLVQNSWGRTCKFADGSIPRPAYNGLVECVLAPDGGQSGRFWIDEELLFNNTTGISTFGPQRN